MSYKYNKQIINHFLREKTDTSITFFIIHWTGDKAVKTVWNINICYRMSHWTIC